MQVHCSKRLIEKLPDNEGLNLAESSVELTEQLPPNVVLFPGTRLKQKQVDIQDLGTWHANLSLIQNKQCIVFVHDITRFSLVIPCILKDDFFDLDSLFIEVFINTLLKLNYPFSIINKASKLLSPMKFDNQCDQSVMGSIRFVTERIEHLVVLDNIKIGELSPCSTSAWLNEMPCSVKGRKEPVWPIQAMREFIERIG